MGLKKKHSRCWTSWIWNCSLSKKILNHWSQSHMDSLAIFLISLNSFMHCDSDLGFLNSFSRSLFISVKDLIYPISVVSFYFMYHVLALYMNVVSSCSILDASSVILFTNHICSHLKLCHSTSSLVIHWNAGSMRVEYWFSKIDLELCLPKWLILVVVDIDTITCKVLLTSTSPSLVSRYLSCFDSLTFSDSSVLYFRWQICKGGASKRGFLHTLSYSMVSIP